MTRSKDAATGRSNTRTPPSGLVQGAAVIVGGLGLGAVTSWAQGVLPDALSSFANSISGWSICTAVLVVVVRPDLARAALLGAASFVCLVLGYTVASQMRGLAYDPTFWVVVGMLGGPFVGAAAVATVGGRRVMPDAALGSGLLGGVLVADGIYGLTVIGQSTSPVYWTIVLVAAAVLLVATAVIRLRAAVPVAVQLGTCAVVFLVLYLFLTVGIS